jgi:excisionase family DNA binding protein
MAGKALAAPLLAAGYLQAQVMQRVPEVADAIVTLVGGCRALFAGRSLLTLGWHRATLAYTELFWEISMAIKKSVTRSAWSVSEISRSTGLSDGFLRKQIKLGSLRARKLGRRVLVLDRDLHIYLEGKRAR